MSKYYMKLMLFATLLAHLFLHQKSNAKIFLTAKSEPGISHQNIENSLRWFTQTPHHFGSNQQHLFARDLKKILTSLHYKVNLQTFLVKAPYPNQSKNNSQDKLQTTHGYNVHAFRQNQAPCAILLGGHYDVKFFSHKKFQGANDGGSSTAMLLELAKLVSRETQSQWKKSQSITPLLFCDIHFVFFDGEEALLPKWDDGKRIFGKPDNLYGSRYFASQLKKLNNFYYLNNKPLLHVFIFDMVGHKNQKLHIFSHSSHLENTFKTLMEQQSIPVRNNFVSIEDDHLPFAEKKIPTLHIIDWDNLEEWHTERDTIDIISIPNIARLVKATYLLLKQGHVNARTKYNPDFGRNK